MNGLSAEAQSFKDKMGSRHRAAAQLATLFIMAGIDMDEALQASRQDRHAIACRVRRLVERERLRGLRRHWSYDLNRHIALKQALDRLRERPA